MSLFRKFHSIKSGILLPVFCFLPIAITYGQDTEILMSSDYSNRLLMDVIEDIESKYPYHFYYLSDWDSLSINLKLSDVSFQTFLNGLSDSTGLYFFIHTNNKIIVTPGIKMPS